MTEALTKVQGMDPEKFTRSVSVHALKLYWYHVGVQGLYTEWTRGPLSKTEYFNERYIGNYSARPDHSKLDDTDIENWNTPATHFVHTTDKTCRQGAREFRYLTGF